MLTTLPHLRLFRFRYGKWERIQFPKVISNFGRFYNTKANECTCPVSGIYMFSVKILSDHGTRAWASIMINNKQLVSTLAHGTDVYLYSRIGTGSNIVVAHCKKGDKVWVRNPTSESMKLHDEIRHYTSFSGFLITKT